MIFDYLFKIIADISGWFSPEERVKTARARKKEIEVEIRKLLAQPWTPNLARRMEKLQNELQKINNKLFA